MSTGELAASLSTPRLGCRIDLRDACMYRGRIARLGRGWGVRILVEEQTSSFQRYIGLERDVVMVWRNC
jgi:hypothetical protein